MRILQLITRRQLRGAEVFAAQLADGLAARGHSAGLTALYGPPAGPPLPVERAEWLDLDHRPRRWVSARLVGSLAARFRTWEPDLVQANGSDTLKYAVLARRLSGRSFPIVYRNISLASAWLRGSLHRAWNRWLARQADHVAAVSPESARDYAFTYGLPPERITAIPIGTPIPPESDREAAKCRIAALFGRKPPGTVILHAASFTPEKDHLTLVEAFARVGQGDTNACLILAGDGPLRPMVRERLKALGCDDRVVLPGAQPDLPALMAGADLFVLSSRIEGLPGVLLEAAAAGLPIVATDVGSVADVVIQGRTGLLVPPGDPRALAEALETLLGDQTLRRALATEGRMHVRRNFDLEWVIDRFLELYGVLTRSADG